MSGKALPAEHNGDIWSREATQHGAIPAAKIVLFLSGIGISIINSKRDGLPQIGRPSLLLNICKP